MEPATHFLATESYSYTLNKILLPKNLCVYVTLANATNIYVSLANHISNLRAQLNKDLLSYNVEGE
jgi:hypothetical protein